MLATLPDYMVPAAYVRLDKFPLNTSGKIDRKALPAPKMDAFAVRDYEAPEGEVEIKIAAIWAELLNVDKVGRRDNFFALGGNSLLVVRLVERIRGAGIPVDVRVLFTAPTLAELVQNLSADAGLVEVPQNRIPEPVREQGELSQELILRL
jgi:aryl carrier-like protein